MRLFTAVELPADAVEHLRQLQDSLRATIPGVRWTPPGNLHITLKFLGETPDALAPELCAAMSSVAAEAMELYVANLIFFPPRGSIRIVAAGLGGDAGAMGELFSRVQNAAALLGFPRETRAYHPHITLARAKNPLHAALREAIETQRASLNLPGPRFTTSGFTLFESRLTNTSATYMPLFRRHI
jgi:2'-5' RNA ligase